VYKTIILYNIRKMKLMWLVF